jgi:hypothetical protein
MQALLIKLCNYKSVNLDPFETFTISVTLDTTRFQFADHSSTEATC